MTSDGGRVGVVVVLLWVFIACAKSEETGEGQVASTGAFAEPCIGGTTCSQGLLCIDSGTADGLCSTRCESSADCTQAFSSSARCEDGACVLGCQTTADCPANSRCNKQVGSCRAPTEEEMAKDAAESAEGTTQNVVIERLRQAGTRRIDLLFVIDNSLAMANKQRLLAEVLPDLVTRLVDPVCVSPNGDVVQANFGCPQGFARQFWPVDDLHVGVLTSSMGGTGAELDCTNADEGETDNGHLLGSLDRARSQLDSQPFLT